MAAGWRGYYINLDASPERRAATEATLARAGLAGAYRRFAAITGAEKPAACRLRPGQYGCFRSHHDLIAGLAPDGRFVHVLEDDSVLAAAFRLALASAIAGHALDPFDIVFTETMVMGDLALIRMLKALFDRNAAAGRSLSLSLIDLATTDFAGTTSYFINPRSLGRVAESLKRGLAAGPARPVDLHYVDEAKAGRLKIGLLFPFTTSVDMGHRSTVAPEDASTAASLILRNAFFVEADMAASRRALAAATEAAGLKADARLDLIGDILRFMVSDRFRPF